MQKKRKKENKNIKDKKKVTVNVESKIRDGVTGRGARDEE